MCTVYHHPLPLSFSRSPSLFLYCFLLFFSPFLYFSHFLLSIDPSPSLSLPLYLYFSLIPLLSLTTMVSVTSTHLNIPGNWSCVVYTVRSIFNVWNNNNNYNNHNDGGWIFSLCIHLSCLSCQYEKGVSVQIV